MSAAGKLIAEMEGEFNAKTNQMIERHAEQITQLMLDRDWLTTVGGAIHANKLRHGWKVTGRGAFESDPEQVLAVLMLVVTEVAEAAEAVRKTDELNFREELADIVIRVIGLAHGMGIDMRAEILAKVEKNSTREHKHGGKRV